MGGAGYAAVLAVVPEDYYSRLKLSSLSLGLFLINGTSFTLVLVGLNLLASSSFLNSNSLLSTSSTVSYSIA